MQYNVTFWVVNSTIGPPLVAFAVMADYALYYSGQFVLSKDKYDPTGKAAWIAELLAKNPVPGVRLCSPKPTSLNNASCVHSENYLLAMQTGQPVETANSSKITWDPGLADGLERLWGHVLLQKKMGSLFRCVPAVVIPPVRCLG